MQIILVGKDKKKIFFNVTECQIYCLLGSHFGLTHVNASATTSCVIQWKFVLNCYSGQCATIQHNIINQPNAVTDGRSSRQQRIRRRLVSRGE